MKKFTLLISLIIFAFPLFSKNAYRILGDISNINDVGTYSVILKIGNDSIIGTFTTPDFKLPIDSIGEYSVKISSHGFEPVFMLTQVDCNKETEANIGSFKLEKLKSIELGEVTVTAERLKIKNIGSTSEFTNLRGTYLGDAGSILDMLGWTPGIMVRGVSDIILFNGTSAEIYIDDRRVVNRSELLLLRSDDVAKIEVIRDPGARYSKSQAVINITLRKKVKDYLGLNVNNTTKFKRKVSNATDINLSGKAGKFTGNIAFRYDLDNTLSYSEQFTQITNSTTGKAYTDLTTGTSIRHINAYHFFGGMNYKINSKSNITAQYSFGIMDYNRDFDYIHNVKDNTNIYSYNETHRLPKIDNNTHSALLGYYLTLNSESAINLTVNYLKKKNAQEQFIVIRPDANSDPTNKIDVESQGDYDLANFEGNYSFTVNKTNMFDMGLNSYYISNNTRNITNEDLQFSNRKDYVQGAYFSYKKSLKKFILSAEIRYEYNYTKLTNNLADNVVRNYNDVLPFLRVIYIMKIYQS